MGRISHHSVKSVVFTALLIGTAAVASDTAAQERAAVQERQAVEVKRATVQKIEVSPEANANALRSAIEQCGLPCKMGSSRDIAAPGGGGTLDYSCDDDGNCACFGAKDCVAMTDICNKDTIGCNKQGCICEKSD